jgi:hypothetical protein
LEKKSENFATLLIKRLHSSASRQFNRFGEMTRMPENLILLGANLSGCRFGLARIPGGDKYPRSISSKHTRDAPADACAAPVAMTERPSIDVNTGAPLKKSNIRSWFVF